MRYVVEPKSGKIMLNLLLSYLDVNFESVCVLATHERVTESFSSNETSCVSSNEYKACLYRRGHYSATLFELECHLAIFNHDATFTDIDNSRSYFFKQLGHDVIERFLPFWTVAGRSRVHKAGFAKCISRVPKSKRGLYEGYIGRNTVQSKLELNDSMTGYNNPEKVSKEKYSAKLNYELPKTGREL